MDDLAKDVRSDWERGDGERGTFKTSWQQIADYMHTERNDYIVERTPGQKRMQRVFDALPVWALQQFAAGLHSYLTSPYLPWFMLRADDDRLNRIQRVRAWLEAASAAMYTIFNGPHHNFASQSQEVYLDAGSIGTAVMAVLESPRSGILFSTRHLKECVIAENEEDRIDRVVRRFPFTAKQAVERWDDKAGAKVLKAFVDNPEQRFYFYHRVKPRRVRDPQRADRRHKPFESVWVSEADMTVIDEGGFDEFPYLVPRFYKVSGEVYGRGPGWTALPDVKMLNEMAKTILKGAQKVVDPPLQLPDDGFIVPIKTTPGSLNYYRAGSRPTDRIAPIETKGQISLGIEMLNALRQQILKTFYVEFMMMPVDPQDPASSGKGITATYVLNQRDQHMRLLSPMLARFQSEFLEPLISRTFAILWRKSQRLRFGPGSPFPPPPPEISGLRFHVEYVSPIAVAQKSSQLDGVKQLLQMQQILRTINPQAPIVLDEEAIMRLTGEDLNAPVAALKSRERMQQEAEAQQQAQQRLQQAAMVAHLAGAAKDGGAGIKSLAEAHQAATQGAGDEDQIAEAA